MHHQHRSDSEALSKILRHLVNLGLEQASAGLKYVVLLILFPVSPPAQLKSDPAVYVAVAPSAIASTHIDGTSWSIEARTGKLMFQSNSHISCEGFKALSHLLCEGLMRSKSNRNQSYLR